MKVLKAPKFDLTKLMDVHGDYTEEVCVRGVCVCVQGGRVHKSAEGAQASNGRAAQTYTRQSPHALVISYQL